MQIDDIKIGKIYQIKDIFHGDMIVKVIRFHVLNNGDETIIARMLLINLDSYLVQGTERLFTSSEFVKKL